MISIFNGRKRTLGGETSQVYAQVGVKFRDHLHLFKGAKLGVFLAIALHADGDGWAWPSYRLLARETGYNKDTIARALSDLCDLAIEGNRVLLRRRTYNVDTKKLESNRYLIFPTADDVAKHEVADLQYIENQYIGNQCIGNQYIENQDMKDNHIEQEPAEAEPVEAEPAAAAALPVCSIHDVPMQLRRAKDGSGNTWYSHKLADGQWCKGRDGDQPTKERNERSVGESWIAAGAEH